MLVYLRRGGGFLLGALSGAVLMFLFDPVRGRRRRALARDRAVHAGHALGHLRVAARARTRDLRNRARGVLAEARGRAALDRVDDAVLLARVRARLGHLVANLGAIDVTAHHGCITLGGTAPAAKVNGLLTMVGQVPGVCGVVDHFRVPVSVTH